MACGNNTRMWGFYFLTWEGLGVFNSNGNLAEGHRRGCEIFFVSIMRQRNTKTKAGDDFHLLFNSIRCCFQKWLL